MFQILLLIFGVLLVLKLFGYVSDLEWRWVFLPIVLIVALPAMALIFFVVIVQIALLFG